MQKSDSGYDLIFDILAIKYLGKLNKNLRERIFNKIQAAKQNPFYFFERLERRTDYKLRIGDYRVIADITDHKIIITKIGHRRNIYKRKYLFSI